MDHTEIEPKDEEATVDFLSFYREAIALGLGNDTESARHRARLPQPYRPMFVLLREVSGHGLCAVQCFLWTAGLLTDLEVSEFSHGYQQRYCYESLREAIEALRQWDGAGDPPGLWIKEKMAGRLGPGWTPPR